MVTKKKIYPILPLRDIVVYPKMIVPLFVGREKSIQALQNVAEGEQGIVLLTQKDATVEEPTTDDVYSVGTIGTILQLLKLPDGTVKVLIEGVERVKIKKFSTDKDYMSAEIEFMPQDENDSTELEAMARAVISQF